MQTIERGGYTRGQIVDMLHGRYGSRTVKFRYDLLDKEERLKGRLNKVMGGEVKMQEFATIKRSAKITMSEDDAQKIDWLSDMLQVFIMFKMPDGGWIEYSLGVFHLSSPTRSDSDGEIVRNVEAYDKLVALDQDKILNRIVFPAGTTYDDAVKQVINDANIIGLKKISISYDRISTMRQAREFEPGKSRLEVINALLRGTGNTILWADANGYYKSEPYLPPSKRSYQYTYETNDMSVIMEGVEEELDTFEIANSWVATLSNPDLPPMSSSLENNNPDSPLSIPSRGRRITDHREVEDIADQQALDTYVRRIANETTEKYSKIVFTTAIMPFHGKYDILRIKYDPLGIDESFSETSWTIPLEAGGKMEHEARRIVTLI